MKWSRLVGLAVLIGFSGAAAEEPAAPVILTPVFSTRAAVEVKPTDHGRPGQNAHVDWTVVGNGPAAGHGALYLFCSTRRPVAAGPPLMAQIDLTDGKLREFYPGDPIQLKSKEAPDLMGGDPIATPRTKWQWGKPLCGATGRDGRLDLALAAKSKGGAPSTGSVLVIYDPHADTFQEVANCPTNPVGMANSGNTLWLLNADGLLQSYDEVGGLQPVGRIPNPPSELSGLAVDDQQNFYTTFGPAPWRLVTLTVDHKVIKATPLLPDLAIDSLTFQASAPAIRCEAVIAKAGHFTRQCFELQGGQATPLAAPTSIWRAWAGKQEYELETNFDCQPLEIAAHFPGQDWKRFPVEFSRAAWDQIKTLLSGPGQALYGAGWGPSWIWRFDLLAHRFKIFASHYVLYEMHTWKDEIWATGYWGIKLLRWRPEEPWTFDYDRHYYHKKFPSNTSPWGDKDISNPRLVCKFRYLKKLELRRPGGMTITDDGCAWVGARTPTVENFESRFGGAVNWYDPATEIIGQICEPFIHHSVRDICRAGPFHVAVAATTRISAYEPLPDHYSTGKFALIDTRTRSVVLESSPLDAPLSYAEEGAPGRIVVYGAPGKYAGEGIRGAFFIFDMAKMQVTHIIRLPVKLGWQEYDNATRFERGPDGKIYFYGNDGKDVALCRVDSVTGTVEPVLRGSNITDVATYVNMGAPFAFCGDRVYFGAQRLVSVPLQTVIGAAATTGGKP